MKKLALYDFDHCLTTRDSFLEFLYYCLPKWKVHFIIAMKLPILWLKGARLFKESVMRSAFHNWDETELAGHAESFAHYRLPEIMKQTVYDDLKSRKDNYEIYVVSASLDLWLSPWCAAHNIGLICTNFDLKERRITSNNCKGTDKVDRIQHSIQLSEFNEIFVAGNLPEDDPMLSLGTEKMTVKK